MTTESITAVSPPTPADALYTFQVFEWCILMFPVPVGVVAPEIGRGLLARVSRTDTYDGTTQVKSGYTSETTHVYE